ncbi:hypothetical protein PHISCL_05713 [Aspergillus sclerotialis]|uniref:Uncharacterized protein n=1 Tax=Aspergillus sclerotialis TaxID=2070753 RepID=A0A3A2ZFH8_9EURO|nr:hypothetical protein PHISCL_05713 [Aspergillus sclerotialis]
MTDPGSRVVLGSVRDGQTLVPLTVTIIARGMIDITVGEQWVLLADGGSGGLCLYIDPLPGGQAACVPITSGHYEYDSIGTTTLVKSQRFKHAA